MRIHDLLLKIGVVVLLGHRSAALGAEAAKTSGDVPHLAQGVWVWTPEVTMRHGAGWARAIRLEKGKGDWWTMTVADIAFSSDGVKLASVHGPIAVSTNGHILEYRTRRRRVRHTFRFERDHLILLPAYYGLAANHGLLPDGVSCPTAEQKRYSPIASVSARIRRFLEENLPGGIPAKPCDQYDYYKYDIERGMKVDEVQRRTNALTKV